MKYIIYCRKSSESEDKQILSIDSQKRELLEIAKKDNLNIVKIFAESKSAYKRGREEFNKMIQMIENGQADAILVYHITRIARNMTDGGIVIDMLKDKVLKEIRTPSQIYNKDSSKEFFLTLEFAMSKKSSDDTSEFVKRDLKAKILKGEYPSLAPIGYLNIDKEGKIAGKHYRLEKQQLLESNGKKLKRIEPDPILAPNLANIFEMYAKGIYTISYMSKEAYKLGITGLRSNKRLAKQSMIRILTNPMYYGAIKWKGEVFEPEELPTENCHRPIITKELFDQVQEVLGNKAKPRKNLFNYKFKGFIKCGECGYSIIGDFIKKPSGREYTYYRCSKRGGKCGQSGINENELEEQLKKEIDKISLNEFQWKLAVKYARIKHNKYFDNEIKQKKIYQKELVDIENRLNALLNLRLDEEIDLEEYKHKKKELIKRQKDINEILNDNSQVIKNRLNSAEVSFEKAYNAPQIFAGDNIEAKRIIIADIGGNFILKDKILTFEHKKPFDYIAEHKPQNLKEYAVGTLKNCLDKQKNRSFDPNFAFVRSGRDSNSRPLP